MSKVPAIQPLALRLADVAKCLSVSRRHLERLVAAGQFPPADRQAGRARLWAVSTVERWLGGDTRTRRDAPPEK